MKAVFYSLKWALCLSFLMYMPYLSVANDGNCEDDVVFSIYCPDDVTVSCDAELWDLSVYGNATYHDYTGWHDAGYPTEHWNLNSCNAGTITRTWTVEDYNWNIHTCSQTITVSGGSTAFNYYSINWPDDIELAGCNPPTHPSQLPTDSSWPTYDYAECTNIGVSYEDHVYTVNNACRKIIREWKVMDWCQYQPGHGWGNGGMWTYNQKIKIIGGEVPEITCQEEVLANSYNCTDAWVDVDPVYVDGDACGDHYTVTNNSPYADSNGGDISGRYPIGTTMVKYTVQYGCGKRKQCTTKVVVKDKKGPTVYCYGEITIALMPVDEDHDGIPEDGMAEIWAKDLDKGSTANCNGHSLTFSFSPDVMDMSKTFTCENVGDNEVRMYVTDYYGRQSYCIVNVRVQNNGANIPDCEPTVVDEDDDDGTYDTDSTYMFSIGGTVMASLYDQPFMAASLELTNMEEKLEYITISDTTLTSVVDSFINHSGATLWYTVYDTTITTTTDTLLSYETTVAAVLDDGHFMFESIADSTAAFELEVTTTIDEPFNGVDRNDLEFLLAVILGDKELETIAARMAADINKDQKVNFDDLKIMLDYLASGTDQVLQYEWLVASTKALEQKEGYLEEVVPTQIAMDGADQMDHHYTAVKIGDLVREAAAITTYGANDDVVATLVGAESIQELETKLRAAETATHAQSLTISPNPYTDRLQLSYQDDMAGTLTVELMDVTGKVLYTTTETTTVGHNHIAVHFADQRYTGIVVYRVIDGSTMHTGKLLRL